MRNRARGSVVARDKKKMKGGIYVEYVRVYFMEVRKGSCNVVFTKTRAGASTETVGHKFSPPPSLSPHHHLQKK